LQVASLSCLITTSDGKHMDSIIEGTRISTVFPSL